MTTLATASPLLTSRNPHLLFPRQDSYEQSYISSVFNPPTTDPIPPPPPPPCNAIANIEIRCAPNFTTPEGYLGHQQWRVRRRLLRQLGRLLCTLSLQLPCQSPACTPFCLISTVSLPSFCSLPASAYPSSLFSLRCLCSQVFVFFRLADTVLSSISSRRRYYHPLLPTMSGKAQESLRRKLPPQASIKLLLHPLFS